MTSSFKLFDSTSNRTLLWIGLFSWFVLNLLQAFFTELFHDEAYYWVFSRHLSFVYFDQMPAVAIVIRAGELFFSGELGVRLFTVLISAPVLFGMYRLTEVKDPKWFFAIVFSSLIIHVNGFFCSPDSVLSLTILLFLFSYKKWLEKPEFISSLIISIAGAAVVYSKYQGILFIVILYLLQLRQWKKWTFWIPLVVIPLLSLPIYFGNPEVVHETLKYHLIKRNIDFSAIENLVSFAVSQLVVLGPLATPLIIIALFLYKPENSFWRSLRNGAFIYYAALLLLSFKTHVEANWSGPVIPVLFMLSVKYWSQKPTSWKWHKIVLCVSLIILLPVRVYLAYDFLPGKFEKIRPEFRGWRAWAADVKKICGNEPVVFSNSYQLPSKYWFYSGVPATCVYNCRYRKNQFSLMPMEKEWQGKAVWIATGESYFHDNKTALKPGGYPIYLKRVDPFYSYYDIHITPEYLAKNQRANDTISCSILIRSTGKERKLLAALTETVKIGYAWKCSDNKIISGECSENLNGKIISQDGIKVNIHFPVPETRGKSILYLYLITDNYMLSENSEGANIIIE